MKFCEKCGNSLSDEKFCPKCGSAIREETEVYEEVASEPPVNSVFIQKRTSVFENIKSYKKPLIVSVAVILILIIVISVLNSGTNLKKTYKKYCDPIWSNIASDGSYLTIDTNPYDIDNKGIAYYDACVAIQDVNKALGLPESLYNDMMHTSGSDGRQSEDFKKITVSWKYHPDNGLEVTYKKR